VRGLNTGAGRRSRRARWKFSGRFYHPVAAVRRRIEIVAFERERVVRRPTGTDCPVCGLRSEMLTARQAAALAQVRARSVRRWLSAGKAHGVRTAGGQYRVCKLSLFLRIRPPSPALEPG
jgi:hypothetical protein